MMRLTTMTIALAALMAGTASGGETRLPTGQLLTPVGIAGARFSPLTMRVGPLPSTIADGAASIVTSPDGARLAILTSGYNRTNGPDGKLVAAQSGQYVFLYDIIAGRARWAQTLSLPNSFSGLAWLPLGDGLVVTGGVDDNVHLFRRARGGMFVETAPPIALGHSAGIGSAVKPQAAGIAVSGDGRRALVANYYNDSVSLVDLVAGRVIAERDLRPGRNDPAKHGVPGGEFPFALAWDSGGHAFVSSPRDREIIALDIGAASVTLGVRIAVKAEPTALLLDLAAHRLYATGDNDDRLAIVDTTRLTLVGEPRLSLPPRFGDAALGKGLNPNALAQAKNGKLFVTLGGINAVAQVSVSGAEARVEGLMPTGWYPSGVAESPRDGRLFVINRKSPAGANPLGCPPKLATVKAQPTACGSANQYIFQLEKAGLLELPRPTPTLLSAATAQVLRNIGVADPGRAAADATMAQLRSKIRHVVYIVKENRTYDQVLGDLPVGNGDPHLAILGQRLSPNHHKMASEFVTLDNFYDSGEQSSTGWTWTTAARVPDLLEKTAPVNYADRGLAYEAEQLDRNIATALNKAERRRVNPAAPDDDDVLPGPALLTAPDGDGDDEAGRGFLWNAALKAGLTVRNYGFADASVYDSGLPGEVPQIREPHREGKAVHVTADRALVGLSDPYFRGFDQKMPDYWREREWEREFAEQERAGVMPNLTLLRLSHDHFGDFDKAIDGVDTVETQMADNDYAVGLVLERIAHSRFKDDTLVFVIEDDAQNGADHVDARRSIAFVVGPFVRHNALVSTHYTTVSMVRTIGTVLGLPALGLNDGLAAPMADVFDLAQTSWDFTAVASDVLRATRLPIPATRFAATSPAARTDHDAGYWANAMKGQDFRSEDRLDTAAFNAALWRGLASESQSGPRPAIGTSPSAADAKRSCGRP
jgi:DNA-binding beta-propeller fold protein YncE